MRNRWMLLLAGAALALPASASAATLGEITPLDLRGDEDCAGATGAPGELVVDTKTGVRFLTASREGFRFGQAVALGEDFGCEAVKVRANGAGVIVGHLNGAVVAAVRDPGGTWSAPITIAKDEGVGADGISADVSDRGDAIVAYKASQFDEKKPPRFQVAVRAPGGAFGAAQPVGSPSKRLGDIVAGIAGTGEAFLVTTEIKNDRVPFQVPVEVRVAPPGGAFGEPVHVADTHLLNAPALDVGADGRALIAVTQGTSLVVVERAPGEGFSAATPVGSAGDAAFAGAEVKLGPGGSAAIAWLRLTPLDLQVVTRAAPGAFSPPVVAYNASGLLPAGFDPFYFSETYFAALGLDGLSSSTGDSSLALTPDGRAVLTVVDGARATLATTPLAGGGVLTATSGTVFGSSDEGLPLVLADGTPAAIWTESPSGQFGGVISGSERYRLHLAAEGVAERPDPPAPRVTLGAPASRTVGQKGLKLPITCSAACVVVATIDSDLFPLGAEVRMARAGRRTLTLDGAALAAPERLGPVRIRLRYGAPDALHPRERTVTLRLMRGAGMPIPDVSRVHARRVGDRIRVTFRVSDSGDDELFVSGDDTRGWSGEPAVTRTVAMKKGKRDYSVTLPAKGVNYVTVRVPFIFTGLSKTVVKVR